MLLGPDEYTALLQVTVLGKRRTLALITTMHNWRDTADTLGKPPHVFCTICKQSVSIMHTLRYHGFVDFVGENEKTNTAGVLDSSYLCHGCAPPPIFEVPTLPKGSRNTLALRIRDIFTEEGDKRHLLMQYQLKKGEPLRYGWFASVLAGTRQMDSTLFRAQAGEDIERIVVRLQPKLTRTVSNDGIRYNGMHTADKNIPSKLSKAKGFH